jgi:hypothetical protein
MPELETRFADIPDWLNYKQPGVPSFLETRQDNREQARSGREERALQMREELQPYAVENNRIENETAKAALEYTMQTRAAEAKAATLATQIEKLDGGWGSIEAITLWQNEVLRNPAIANSKVGELIGRNIGTALQYGKTLEDAKRRLEFEQQRNAITEERYRLNAEQAQSRALGQQNSPEDIARVSFREQMTTLRSEQVSARNIPDPTERAREMARIRKDVSELTRKYNRVIGIEDMGLEALPEQAEPENPNLEKVRTLRQALQMWEARGNTTGTIDFDKGTIYDGWGRDTPIKELKAKLDEMEKEFGAKPSSSSSGAPSSGGTVILKAQDIK